jgi:hypothetical protein
MLPHRYHASKARRRVHRRVEGRTQDLPLRRYDHTGDPI